MAGVDELGMWIADENVAVRLVLRIMTSTIVTKTNRFRATVVSAGVMNLSSMAGTCDIPEFNRPISGAWPWGMRTFMSSIPP